LTNRNTDCFIYFSIIFNRNHLIQIGIVQRMIREYILLSDGLSVANINFTVVCQPKLRLMESDYRKLQQSQDNNSVMQNQMCISTAGCFVCCAIPIAKAAARSSAILASKRDCWNLSLKAHFVILRNYYSGNPFKQISLCFVLKVFWGKSLFKFMSNKDVVRIFLYS
jgi:hypothetical protein